MCFSYYRTPINVIIYIETLRLGKNDHYIFDEKKFALIGYQTKISYQLGQKVKIKIQKADLERKQMDFILV